MQSARELPRDLARPRRAKSNDSAGADSSGLPKAIADLAAQYRPGWSLPGPFYYDPEVYRCDINRIWRKGWLFAGHTCEIPKAGDYFLVEFDTDSIVIIRAEGGTIRAFHNVCRHRGSLICTEASGQVKKLVCPYHQWTYGLDGKLMACRGMPEEIEKHEFSLKPVTVHELEGLIYISLSESPSDPTPACGTIAPL